MPRTRLAISSSRASIIALSVLSAVGCAGLVTQPGVFTATRDAVDIVNSPVTLTVAKPDKATTPPFLVIFASGDGGLMGVSLALVRHLAEQGYYVVGFSSPEAFERVIKHAGSRPNFPETRNAFSAIVRQSKHALNLPDSTPVVVSGMSRGANVVIAAAADQALQPGVVGAVAVALTREFDALTLPKDAQLPGIVTDDKGRIQTYPAISRLGSIPLAIIQSTNDSYVTSSESRRLLGPDTPTRRLYEVDSRNHNFGGGQEMLMRDLDDAMRWIVGLRAGKPAASALGSARHPHG